MRASASTGLGSGAEAVLLPGSLDVDERSEVPACSARIACLDRFVTRSGWRHDRGNGTSKLSRGVAIRGVTKNFGGKNCRKM